MFNTHKLLLDEITSSDEWVEEFDTTSIDLDNNDMLRYLFLQMWKGYKTTFSLHYRIARTTLNTWLAGRNSAVVTDAVKNYLIGGGICKITDGCRCREYFTVDQTINNITIKTANNLVLPTNINTLIVVDSTQPLYKIIDEVTPFRKNIHLLVINNTIEFMWEISKLNKPWITVIGTYAYEPTSFQTIVIASIVQICSKFNDIIILSDKYFSLEPTILFKNYGKYISFIDAKDISMSLYLLFKVDPKILTSSKNKIEKMTNMKNNMLEVHKNIISDDPKTYNDFINCAKKHYKTRLYGANYKKLAHTLLKFHNWNNINLTDFITDMNIDDLKNEVKYCCKDRLDLYYCFNIDLDFIHYWLHGVYKLDDDKKEKLLTWINTRY